MKTFKFFPLLTLSASALMLLPVFALAQPDTNNTTTTQNPPNQDVGGNRGMGGRGGNRGFGGRGGFGGNLTPEQRQQQLRQNLTRLGVTDTKEQDAILAYSTENETALQKLRTKWNALSIAVRNTVTTENQLAGLLNDFRSAMDDEMTRRTKARAALETKLGLSKKPRLETQLMISGLLGDDAALIQGGGPGGFGGGFGGRGGGFGGGGFGGGRGGGFGGFGGGF